MTEREKLSPQHSGHDVAGYCPMGCGRTLFLGEGGYITCGWFTCPDPEAVTKLLSEPQETDHIAVFGTDGTFTLMHPLLERLQPGGLEKCGLHTWLASLDGPPVTPGRYRVKRSKGLATPAKAWQFEEQFEEMENDHG